MGDDLASDHSQGAEAEEWRTNGAKE
jgi:hypothetical protein